MINIKFIKENYTFLKKNLKRRNINLNFEMLNNFDNKIRKKKNLINKDQNKNNIISNLIKILIKKSYSIKYFTKEVILTKKEITKNKQKLNYLEKKLKLFILSIPNCLNKTVPEGKNETENKNIRLYSINNFKKNKKAKKDFEENFNYIDFNLSSQTSGSGFAILKNKIASLHRAIGNYMIDYHIKNHGYTEIYSPLIVNEKSMFNSGHFPKFINDQFNLNNTNLWLIPTSEVILTNIVNNKLINQTELPLKFVSKSSCFRKEKGNYGKKVKGLIRQHQFEKVELVQITEPKKSYNALEEILYHAEKILQNFKLPYRTILLCSNDTGFTSSKTYDIEVWYPKRKAYIEVSSCSNTESFQSFRMNAKIKQKNKFIYPHILNGSGLAIGRILLAIIENYSDDKGNIIIPKVLKKYISNTQMIKI